MLDLLKIKICTKFMKGYAADVVAKKIYQKLGCKMDIQFTDIEVNTVDGDIVFHVDAVGCISKTEFEKLLKKID